MSRQLLGLITSVGICTNHKSQSANRMPGAQPMKISLIYPHRDLMLVHTEKRIPHNGLRGAIGPLAPVLVAAVFLFGNENAFPGRSTRRLDLSQARGRGLDRFKFIAFKRKAIANQTGCKKFYASFNNKAGLKEN